MYILALEASTSSAKAMLYHCQQGVVDVLGAPYDSAICDVVTIDPQGAVDQIYATLGRRIGLVEPTAEQLQSVVGLDPDDYTSAYVRYVETDFGADDVYIVLPKEGEDENGNSHRENIIAQLRERKDARVREFANYDVYNSASIAENAVIFERGGYVVMLMLEDNDAARSIVERYIPERLNLS